jgi:hypothetical protein
LFYPDKLIPLRQIKTYKSMEYKICNLKGFEGLYHIYENGDIYSIRKRKLLNKQRNGTYYVYIYVTLQGHNKQILRTSVHRLVAHHFICPEPERNPFLGRYEVNHIDMNKENNHYTNLEWITHSKNMLNARGLKPNWSKGVGTGRKPGEEARHKMSEAKKKKVLLFNDNQEFILDSIGESANYLKVGLRTFSRYANTCKTLNGFKIKLL